MDKDQPFCHHCGLPIRSREPRWTIREPEEIWHYKCADEDGLTTFVDSDQLRIRQKLREMMVLIKEVEEMRFMIALLERQLRKEKDILTKIRLYETD